METEKEIEIENCLIKAVEEESLNGEENHTTSDRMTPPGEEPSRPGSTSELASTLQEALYECAELLGQVIIKARHGHAVKDMRMRLEGDVLPVSAKELENSQAGKAKSLEAFLAFIFLSVIDIPAQFHCALLILCVSFLSYHQGKTLTTPSVSKFGNSTNDASVLSFGEAFPEFFPMMIHITEFILCYLLTLFLAWPLQVGVQIFVVLLLIYVPFRFFPEMVRKASGVYVACGSFKLPLFWFTTFGGIGLSLFCLSLLLLVIYFRWCMNEGSPTVKELKVSLDDLSEIS